MTEAHALPLIVANMKKGGRLIGCSEADILAECATMLEAHDTGDIPNLGQERLKRSPEMHDPDFRAKLKAAGEGAGAATTSSASEGDHSDSCAPGCGHSLAGHKRPRPAEEEGDGADGSDDVEALISGGGGGNKKGKKFVKSEAEKAEEAAAGKAFQQAIMVLRKSELAVPGKFAPNRYRKAASVFERCNSTDFGLIPNARSYVLMLYGAVTAGLIDEAKGMMARFLTSGVVGGYGDLYLHMQPSFMSRLVSLGVMEDRPETLDAPHGSDKWCFLKAAEEAALGDQQGSKHGSVIRKNGAVLSWGHNHRYGVPNDKHLRVMHAEVHALVKIAEQRAAKVKAAPDASTTTSSASSSSSSSAADDDSESSAFGSEVFIVELDGQGVGYEEATPCSMCQTGLCQLGVAQSHFSSHSGLVTVPVSHRPHLHCETYAMGLQRIYPKGSKNPDHDAPEQSSGSPSAAVASAAPSPASAKT